MEKPKSILQEAQIVDLPEFKEIRNEKSSTTSSIMIGSTITKPDVRSIINAVATILQSQMMEDNSVGKEIISNSDLYFFCEEKYISEKPEAFDEQRLALLRETPTVENIYEFLQALYDCAQFRYNLGYNKLVRNVA